MRIHGRWTDGGRCENGRASRRRSDVAAWTLAAIVAFPLSDPRVIWLELTPTIAEYALPGIPVLPRARAEAPAPPTVLAERHAAQDVERVAVAVALGSGVTFAVGLGLYRWSSTGFPRTVPLIAGILALTWLAGDPGADPDVERASVSGPRSRRPSMGRRRAC